MEGSVGGFRIGVISDTHIRRLPINLPERLYQIFEDVDMILHAGDIQHQEVLYELSAFAPVYAVAGNCDGWDIAHALGRKRIIDVKGFKIGIVHGSARGDNAWISAYSEFDPLLDLKRPKLDCLIYGHTHAPYLNEVNGMKIMNPGSPTEKRSQPHYTVGMIEIMDGRLETSIIQLDD